MSKNLINRIIKKVELPQSYSNLLDLPNSPSPIPYKRAREPRLEYQNDWTLSSKILSSHVRRCIQSQRLTPIDFMIQFKIVQPPPPPAVASLDGIVRLPSIEKEPPRFLSPTGLLHPRYSIPKSGSGNWVIALKEAVDTLSSRGSYKRIATNLTMPAFTNQKITSQIARRIVDEVSMYCQRIKSRTGFKIVEDQRKYLLSPIVNLSQAEALEFLEKGTVDSGVEKGMRLVTVLSLDLLDPAFTTYSTSVLTGYEDLLPSTPPEHNPDIHPLPYDLPPLPSQAIPFYRLANLFSQIERPSIQSTSSPISNESTTTKEIVEPGSDLLQQIRIELDTAIRLYHRRLRIRPLESPSNLYALYQPFNTTTNGIHTPPPSDIVPLLLALWRCKMWSGEGWTDSQKDRIITVGRRKK